MNYIAIKYWLRHKGKYSSIIDVNCVCLKTYVCARIKSQTHFLHCNEWRWVAQIYQLLVDVFPAVPKMRSTGAEDAGIAVNTAANVTNPRYLLQLDL